LVATETIRNRISRDHCFVLDLFCHFHAWLHSLLPDLDGAICVALLAAVVPDSDGRKLDLSFRLLQYDVPWNTLVCVRSCGPAGLERLGDNSVVRSGRYRYLRDDRPVACADERCELRFRAICTDRNCAGERR